MKDLRDPNAILHEARTQLRRHLRPTDFDVAGLSSGCEVTLADEAMLVLLLNIPLAHASDEEASRARYSASTGDPEAPSFDALREEGWFQILFGRVVTSMQISLAAGRSSEPAIAALLRERFAVEYDFSSVPRDIPAIADAVTRLTSGSLRFADLDCQTPAWVAARLWERRPDCPDPLRWWLDRWELLQQPHFAPMAVWDASTANGFHELILDRLAVEPSLVIWPCISGALANEAWRGAGRMGPAPANEMAPVPTSSVARACWLGGPALDGMMRMRTDALEEARLLLSILTADVELRRNVAVPDRLVTRILEITLDRPDLFLMLAQRALHRPLLIADLLVLPATSALGCWLLMQHISHHSTMPERAVSLEGELTALRDGLALLERFLLADEASVPPAEAVALLVATTDAANHARSSAAARTAADHVLQMLGGLGQAALPIAASLAADITAGADGVPIFAAALKLATAADLAETMVPDALPVAFIAAVRSTDCESPADRIAPNAAATLYRLAARCGPAQLMQFLYPIDWRATLSVLAESDIRERLQFTRSLEAIARLQASAIIGLQDEAPLPLVEALAHHVDAGSEDLMAGGKIWAFRKRWSLLPSAHAPAAPIGRLLGNAIAALDGAARDRLLAACLQLREPALLAEIYQTAPLASRASIAERIDALPPEHAIPANGLDELHARVDALLDAGLTAPAELHFSAERNATSRGQIQERPRIELAHALRLAYLQEDWAAILAMAVPDALPQIERETCRRMLDGFQALAMLQNNHFATAAIILERLIESSPNEPGYRVNLFAARILEVLGPESFALLPPANRRPARRLVEDVEKWVDATPSATEQDRQICAANLAILDLAIGEPQRAASRLLQLPTEAETAQRAAYLAVAYARLGRARDAHELLDTAAAQFGHTALIDAARNHLTGEPNRGGLGATERAIFAIGLEDVHRLQSAITGFASLSAPDQATILLGKPHALPALVTRQVDAALSGIASLAPLINRGLLPDDEDDITALLKQLLNARVAHLGWSTPDQSKGGYTPKGNYGERDLILVHDLFELAVMEAVIANQSIPRQELTKHFRKLLGYGNCRLYFHLTYAWLPDIAKLIQTLEAIALEEAPKDYIFEGNEPHIPVGQGPRGFTAQYRVDGEVIYVVFLVLDLGQTRLRAAAKHSQEKLNKPSRKPRRAAARKQRDLESGTP